MVYLAEAKCSDDKMKLLSKAAGEVGAKCSNAEDEECKAHVKTYMDLVEECSNHKKSVAHEHETLKSHLKKRNLL